MQSAGRDEAQRRQRKRSGPAEPRTSSFANDWAYQCADIGEQVHQHQASVAPVGLGGIAFGLSVAGLNLLPWTFIVALVGIGTVSMTLYVIHARRTQSPVRVA